MSIYRNTDGFSAVLASDPLADLDLGNPRKWAVFFDDFLAYDITQLIGGVPYTFTQTNCVDTITSPCGILNLTLGGADNDGGELQTVEAPIATNSKRLYFEAKVALSLATGTIAANEIFVGLATIQTTTNFMNAGGTALTVDNCMGFVKYDAGAAASAVLRKSDVESSDASVWTPTDGTYATLSFYFDGASTYFYVDKILKATLSGNEPTGAMAPTLWIKAGEAKANVLKVDYIMCASER